MTDGYEAQDHMGFNLTVYREGGFSRDDQDALFDRITDAVCSCDDDVHNCPLQTMGSCTGTSEEVHRWHMWPWEAVEAIGAINAEDHATKSRDYGRGFAEALRLVRQAIEEARTGTAPSDESAA